MSPALWGRSPGQTLRYCVSAAERAERLRRQHPDRFVLVLGSELTLFMQGIVPGRDFAARTREAFTRVKAGDHSANDRLNDFLGRASTAVRGVYHGPLTYAWLVWEDVNWDRFDLIGVDHYRDARIKDRYVQMLQPLLALGSRSLTPSSECARSEAPRATGPSDSASPTKGESACTTSCRSSADSFASASTGTTSATRPCKHANSPRR